MSPATAWLLLIVSGLVDVAWALAMKKSTGFTEPFWSALSILLLAAFVGLLVKALECLPLGTAYFIWTGIGAVGTLTIGIFVLGESITGARLLFAAVTLCGILGLKLSE